MAHYLSIPDDGNSLLGAFAENVLTCSVNAGLAWTGVLISTAKEKPVDPVRGALPCYGFSKPSNVIRVVRGGQSGEYGVEVPLEGTVGGENSVVWAVME